MERLNLIRDKLVSEVHPLYEELKNKDNTVKDYIHALYELGIRLNVWEKLKKLRDSFKEQEQPLMSKEYEQIYRIVMELYDQIVLLLGEEHVGLKEFTEILETGLVEAKIGLIPPGMDEIVIGDTQRTRLKDIRALFFIGFNEGIVPKSIGGGGILSDIDRELLAGGGIELAPTKRQQTFTENFYIYLSMTKPKDKLYITFHRVDEEGKSVPPSYLIGKLMTYFKKLKVIYEDDAADNLEYILQDEGVNYLAESLRRYRSGIMDANNVQYKHGTEGEEKNREDRAFQIFGEIYKCYMDDEEKYKILELLK